MFLPFNSTPTLIETTVKGCIIIFLNIYLYGPTSTRPVWTSWRSSLDPRPLFPIG